ncbi:MAG: SOS response-associated peptidase [Alphaproteobacteria bacterium]|nr:SOS response-associated peptidase [Alphaproteobacteria bacterium]MDX5369605.1 SOS response-associated peptidase [Alphaproteobacteria bacterium]MDX5464256.1 SOS response-associated peptidase [Alphaproteobacteria bacterium]
MCGRFTNTMTWAEIRALYNLTSAQAAPNLAPRWNIAPTEKTGIVRMEGEARAFAQVRWGLVPSWSKGPDSRYSMFNARAETVREKPAFRAAFRARRCLVPATGFYEWQATEHGKQPYLIQPKDEGPMTFAGLWERWEPEDGGEDAPDAIESMTILVTEANRLAARIHDRMPVILAAENFETWLTGDPDAAASLLRPWPDGRLKATPVSTAINRAGRDEEGLAHKTGPAIAD